MTHSCITCTSSRAVAHGPRAGSLWCFVKSRNVNPESACPLYPEADLIQRQKKAALEGKTHWSLDLENRRREEMLSGGPQRVLVKSAAESQFETNHQETKVGKNQAFPSFSDALYSDAA